MVACVVLWQLTSAVDAVDKDRAMLTDLAADLKLSCTDSQMSPPHDLDCKLADVNERHSQLCTAITSRCLAASICSFHYDLFYLLKRHEINCCIVSNYGSQ